MADLGSAFTGRKGPEEEPLKDIITGAGGEVYDRLLGDPASRSALLQIGLQMMQRPGFGSGTGEHIAQSVGAGGEAVGRIAEMDLKQQRADDLMTKAQMMADIAQQRADTAEKAAANKKSDSLSNTLQYTMERNAFLDDEKAKKERREAIDKEVKDRVEELKDPAFVPMNRTRNPNALRFVGKTESEIRRTIEQEYDSNNPRPPARQTTTSVPPTATPSVLPPIRDRVIGQTRIPKKGGGFYVWQGQGWSEE